MHRKQTRTRLATFATITLIASFSHAQQRNVLVLPFENTTNTKDITKVQQDNVSNGEGSSTSTTTVETITVDRNAYAPKSILEDLVVNINGVAAVERQRVAALFKHGVDLPIDEGTYDTRTLIKPGYLQGVDALVFGTIESLEDEVKTFKGYGTNLSNIVVTAKIRIRIVDVETGRITHSQRISGQKRYRESDSMDVSSGDAAFEVMEEALLRLADDSRFLAALRGEASPPGAF